MKKLNIKAVFINIILAVLLFVGLAPLFGVNFSAGTAIVVFALGFIPKTSRSGSIAMEGLQTEVWIDQFVENFYPENHFIQDGIDFTQFVDNNKINFAAAGDDPQTIMNRTRAQRPIPVTYADDLALSMELDDFSSDTTVVLDVEAKELAYGKMEVDLNKHRRSIRMKYATSGLFNIAPETETAHTLILEATGHDAITNEACYIDADFSKLKGEWDDREYPSEGRVVVMPSRELEKFKRNSDTLKKQIGFKNAVGNLSSKVNEIEGFEIKTRKTEALYQDNGSGIWVKQPFGTLETAATLHGCVCYIKKHSFAFADGSTTMWDEKSVAYQGYLMNFSKRGLIKPVQQKVLASIVIPKS
ncbi:hypothetical protein PL373_05965 [Tenacibaculum maritimum]|nr:hypothetical protein [Tenacibaculum maritimum]MDB0600696.1 hypothetical protein [Tenacibaculum maritimum]MDB0612679.1 hypothetical protein [Tenacibaculum maritimum]